MADVKYEVVREGSDVILQVDYEKDSASPSIEDDRLTMSRMIDLLLQTSSATKIVIKQKRDFEYDYSQVKLLKEIASLYNSLIKDRQLLSFLINAPQDVQSETLSMHGILEKFIYTELKQDPIGTYVDLKRKYREQHLIYQEARYPSQAKPYYEQFLTVMHGIMQKLENTQLIKLAAPYLTGLHVGDRSAYSKIFHPAIRPDFMFTKIMAAYPEHGEVLDNYRLGNTEVTIFELPGDVNYLYHVIPPEFRLSEEKYEILDAARNIMAEHKPTRSEFVNPELMREVFYNVGHDLIEELVNKNQLRLRQKEVDELTEILVRYTVGFGLIEVLLEDKNIQDISINSPMGNIPMFIVHGKFGDCRTNIIPTPSDGESWATKLRLISGRPLDEANPVLDTEIELPGARARIAVIAPPLNPSGIAYSWRRHRIKPWTLALLVKYEMLTPLAAGLISFLIDGARTMLVAGTRSAGKTSLLGACMIEIMRRSRIITIEDTLELPTDAMRGLGYNIQAMKVAAALSKGSSEVNAGDGIRTTLRLGDSALIVGEVRSEEAKALYEAMRVGALANTVAGTIHGDSPYGVYDRVVNDLKVPKTSFKATDIVIVANPIRSPDGLHRNRRVTQITEIRKHWENDPMVEGGFVDLMTYNAETDKLEVTDSLMNGESEILKSIAGNVKEWAGNWDAVWSNITLRAKMKERIIEASDNANDLEMLEAEFIITANDRYHKISEKVREQYGSLDSDRIYFEWDNWLKDEIVRRRLKK